MADTEEPQQPATAPDSFTINVRGYGADEDEARALGNRVGLWVRELSRHINLAQLDGVTIAGDYSQALAELDRGYKTNFVLTPSDGVAIGIAMTPSVLRDGELKSHIVVNAGVMAAIMDPEAELYRTAVHTLAHECAHVEVTAAYEKCFPNVRLRTRKNNILDAYRWDIILACWDEFAATWISACWGEDPTDGYEQTFLTVLAETRVSANEYIKKFRLHGDVGQVLAEVYGAYGDLLKFSAYHLGNMRGQGLTLADMSRTAAALEGHWFEPYFLRLDLMCAELTETWARWKSHEDFEVIGDLAERLVEDGGVFVTRQADGGVYVNIPFTGDTMP